MQLQVAWVLPSVSIGHGQPYQDPAVVATHSSQPASGESCKLAPWFAARGTHRNCSHLLPPAASSSGSASLCLGELWGSDRDPLHVGRPPSLGVKTMGSGVRWAWLQVPVRPLTSCATMNKGQTLWASVPSCTK